MYAWISKVITEVGRRIIQLEPVIIGVVCGVVSILLWEIVKWLYLSCKRSKPTRLFWDFLDEEICLILSAPHRTVDDVLISWSSFGDVLSYNKIFNFLIKKTKGRIVGKNRLEFLNSEQEWKHQKGKNLIILGGPFYNKVVKSVLYDIYAELTLESKRRFLNVVGFWKNRSYSPDKVEPTYGMTVDQVKPCSLQGLVDVAFSTPDGANHYIPHIDSKSQSGSDYGMIIKTINPYCRKKNW